VQHLPSEFRSNLPQILERAGRLPAVFAADGAKIVPGWIYIAPPDHHVLLVNGAMRLSRGPREHSTRPAVDPLFRSAARAYGPRVIGVILSGALDDGTLGLAAIKAAGGCALVQDPAGALYPSMPESALAVVDADHVLPVEQIGPLLGRLASDANCAKEAAMRDERMNEPGQIARDLAAQERGERADQPSVLTCPECGGVLWEMQNGELLEFRCHVGHLYSPESLDVAQAAFLESALWAAVRALVEKAVLGQWLANRGESQGRELSARRFATQAEEATRAATVLRELLLRGDDDGAEVD
jgi:two-component system, chemotaxis family, protein-glutamate methylesterase/glutaminase